MSREEAVQMSPRSGRFVARVCACHVMFAGASSRVRVQPHLKSDTEVNGCYSHVYAIFLTLLILLPSHVKNWVCEERPDVMLFY